VSVSDPASSRDAWVAAGPHEVAPGVHRIPCPLPHDGLRAVNVYAIEADDGVTLVDTGWRHPDTVRALRDGLAQLGLSTADVRRAICTHIHYDHYGLAGDLQASHDVEVLLGSGEQHAIGVAQSTAAIEAWHEKRGARLLRHGAGEVVRRMDAHSQEELDSIRATSRWSPPDRWLDDGEGVVVAGRTLTARRTPGHTRGHIVLHDAVDGLLFAGDHVLPHITPSLGFEADDDGRSLANFIPALEALRELPARLVLPGHGPPFTDLAGRIDELLEHHRLRLEACCVAVAGGASTTAEVAARLGWTRRETAFADLDTLNQMLAVSETMTHLELLADRGVVERVEGDLLRWELSGR
jgi:glyoxylase-like metal-dependent hydrolase (beta-lactamase superfamily II)